LNTLIDKKILAGDSKNLVEQKLNYEKVVLNEAGLIDAEASIASLSD
jgi:hypothetical protein